MNNDHHKNQEQQILNMLHPKCEIKASDNLRKRVNDTLNSPRKTNFLKWTIGGIGSIAAAVIIIVLTVTPRLSAKDIIKDALALIGDSFVVEFEARTLPSENFAYFDKNLPFSPITLSVTDNSWSIDKEGRKALGNDSVRYMWLPEYNSGWVTHMPKPNFIEDFSLLLNPRRLLTLNLSLPDKNMDVHTEGDHIAITSNKDNLKYQYLFDKSTHRLLSYTISEDDIILLKTVNINYNAGEHLALSVPENINWIDASKVKGVFKGLSAEETAQIALSALKDWQTEIVSQAFGYARYDMELFKELYSGATLLGIGQTRQGATDYKYLVPYRLRLKNSSVQNGELSLERQSDGSWIIDGGI